MSVAALPAPELERAALSSKIAAFAAIYLLWGATFLALRYAVAELPPLLVIAIRCGAGAAILTLWCLVRGTLVRPTAAQWRVAAAAGVLLFLGCHAALAWAEQRVSSGQAALLLTSIPLWLVILDAARRRERPSARALAGLAIGVLGVAVLTEGVGSWSGNLVDRVAIVFGGLAWAAGSMVARHGERPPSTVQSAAMQLAAGAVVVALGGLALGELDRWGGLSSPRALAALAFLVFGGTTLAFAAYTWLLRVTTAAAVGTYAFVNPVVAVALAWAVGDEPVSLRTAVAIALVVAAVALLNEQTRRVER